MSNPQPLFLGVDNRPSLPHPVPVRATFGRYVDNDRLAISLVVHDPEGKLREQDFFDGEPWARVTVNLPEAALPAGAVAIKDWGENEGMVPVLMRMNLIREAPLFHLEQEHVQVPVFPLTTAAQALLAATPPPPPALAARGPRCN